MENHTPARTRLVIAALSFYALTCGHAAEQKLAIRSDFPGGNIVVENNEGSTVRLAPDLRDTPTPWFYWYFEAQASEPGRVTFAFEGAKTALFASEQ